MSVEQNKATLNTIIEEVLNKGNLSLIPNLVDSSWLYQPAFAKELRGPEGFKEFVLMQRNAFSDLKITIEDAVGEGDKVAARMRFQGTFSGKLGEIKPTGKRIDMPFSYFYYYKNGKETGTPVPFMDMLTYYQQLGIKPPALKNVT
jgi:predicted ester cyclase